MSDEVTFEGWAILELMGHRRLAGRLSEVTIGGSSFLRLDIPGPSDPDPDDDLAATQFYSPSAVYCITPTTEAMARQVANLNRPRPVQPWELPPSVDETHDDDMAELELY